MSREVKAHRKMQLLHNRIPHLQAVIWMNLS